MTHPYRHPYTQAGPLLTQPIQTQLMLRLVGSMKLGHTTASLLIAKLYASTRQNSLTRALQEYGRLVRTIYLKITWNVSVPVGHTRRPAERPKR